MWRHAITHRKGEMYRLSDQKMTVEKLGQLGVLSQMDVSYVPRDTTATCDTLDLVVSAVMDKLYDSTFEMNATLKSNQQVGPGISYELAKRNAFRGGEKVSFKILARMSGKRGLVPTGTTRCSTLMNWAHSWLSNFHALYSLASAADGCAFQPPRSLPLMLTGRTARAFSTW